MSATAFAWWSGSAIPMSQLGCRGCQKKKPQLIWCFSSYWQQFNSVKLHFILGKFLTLEEGESQLPTWTGNSPEAVLMSVGGRNSFLGERIHFNVVTVTPKFGRGLRASLVAQMVKNLLVMQETQVRALGQEDPLGKGMVTQLQYSCLGNSMDWGAWRAQVHRL